VQVEAVRRWLRERSGWLLIFDSVDSAEASAAVRGYLSASYGGHVIITSRRRDWHETPYVTSLSLDVLSEDVAADFLCGRLRSCGFDVGLRADALKLAVELGGLPLALEQAAAYIFRHCVTFAEYLRLFEECGSELLGADVEGGTHYQRSVAGTWLVTEKQLSLTARAILRMSAFLASEDIPRDLFSGKRDCLREAVKLLARERKERVSRAGDDSLVESALVELADHSLVKPGPKVFSCHRLVQAVQSGRLVADVRKRWVSLVLRMVDEHVPNPDDVRAWPVWEGLRAHVESIVKCADKLDIPEPTSRLMNELAVFLDAKALYGDAEPLKRRALAIDEKSFGGDHPKVAIHLNNLAALLQATNRLAEAEPLMRRALAIDEKSLGGDHPNVAICLNNLAALLQATNRLAEAEPLMRRALAIDEKSFGGDHPNVAIRLNNLAQLLQATNRLAEAEPLMRRALAIDEKSFGGEHPTVAIRLNNLAALLQATNRLAEAEPLMRRALAIDEKCYGPDHPDVARDLNNLAALLQATYRLAEAEPLMRRALAIDEESFGGDHPKVAIRLNNLAQLLQATNRLAEAEPPSRRALMILSRFAKVTGHRHPSMQMVIGNYASLLVKIGIPQDEIKKKIDELKGQ
jgi:tetratricopeptide (TPR) repeat protein